MRLLILGGSGFIGSSYANWAVALGHDVSICSRSIPKDRDLDAKVKVYLTDATDIAGLRTIFKLVQPETVLFSISQVQPRSETSATYSALVTEIKALLNTLECIDESDCSKLIYLSSAGAVYGGGPRSHKESDICHPKSIYGKMKLQAENLISSLAHKSGTDYAILRLSNPFGPGQSPSGTQGVVPIFIRHILLGEEIHIFGSDRSSKDYIYIGDVNKAIERAIAVCDNHIYNIGSGHSMMLRFLIQKIESECGISARKVHTTLPEQEVASFSIDTQLAATRLNWHAETDMRTGIRQQKQWIEYLLARPQSPKGVAE